MSMVRYDLNKNITMKQFNTGLNNASIKYEVDDKPNNFYPYYRIWFGDIKMAARTNCDGHVVRLVPVDDLTDGHRQLADKIAGLFNAGITVEDFTMWGSGIPWARELWAKQQHEDTAERWGFR
jgi:hypothetical protein